MSKKLAVLLFAIGLGSAASVSAFQQDMGQCAWQCLRGYQACIANGYDESQCNMDRTDCYARCGI